MAVLDILMPLARRHGVSILFYSLLLGLIAVVLDWLRMLRLRRTLPPGPFPLPVVGNHFHIDKVRPWNQWEKWAEYYNSPMTTLWVGRYPRIIVQDAWVASDLMEKRADIFSSRPRLVVSGDLLGITTTNQTMLPYGDRWRMHRKLMHNAVGTQAVRKYRDAQANESAVLIKDLFEDPADFVMSIERYSVSLTSIVGWGRRIDGKNDVVAQLSLAVMEAVNFVVPGQYLMEAIPAMAKLPSWIYGTPAKLRAMGSTASHFFYLLAKEAKEMTKNPSFSAFLFKEQEKTDLSNVELAGLTTNLIGGGVDTTSSTMISFILAMAYFPDVQKKLQDELDRVVGQERSPAWEDVDKNLPYLEAAVKEVLRWRTVTVLAGIPHANTTEFEYRGYKIPAGTNITGNMWAIHRNPRDFPDPDTFRPERFLNSLERPYPNQRGSNPFGWGRRQCSGQPLAEQGLLYSLCRLVWAFNVLPGLDENGKEVKLDIFAYTNSENMRPEPFRVRFNPRSHAIKARLLSEAKTARDALRIYDGETKISFETALQSFED